MAKFKATISIPADNEAQAKKIATKIQALGTKVTGSQLEKMLEWIDKNPTMVNMAIKSF